MNAVTKDDVVRVAQKYIDPDHLAIVIVGDRAKIEGPLAATKIAPIVRARREWRSVATKVLRSGSMSAHWIDPQRIERACANDIDVHCVA